MNPMRLLMTLLLLGSSVLTWAVPAAAAGDEQTFLSELPPEIADKVLEHRLREGEQVPEFTLQDLGGRSVSKKTIRGKPTVLAFFAIDNQTRRERSLELLTLLRELQEKYGDRVNIYAICSDRKGCEAADVKAAAGNLPILEDSQRVAYTLFGLVMMPTSMIIAAQGELLEKLPFSGAVKRTLEGRLQVALGELTVEQLQQQEQVRTPQRSAKEKQALHHLQLARVLVERRIYPQAVAEFAKAAALQPDSSEPLIEQGFIFLRLERWSDAEANFFRALDLDPESISAVAGLGLALHGQGRNVEAQLELEDAAMVTDPLPRVLIALAEIYADSGQKDLALQTYARAFKQLSRELERCEGMAAAGD